MPGGERGRDIRTWHMQQCGRAPDAAERTGAEWRSAEVAADDRPGSCGSLQHPAGEVDAERGQPRSTERRQVAPRTAAEVGDGPTDVGGEGGPEGDELRIGS